MFHGCADEYAHDENRTVGCPSLNRIHFMKSIQHVSLFYLRVLGWSSTTCLYSYVSTIIGTTDSKYFPLIFFLAVHECDSRWSGMCTTIKITNAPFGNCNGAYDLHSNVIWQRPVYYNANKDLEIRYRHDTQEWVRSDS